MVITKAFVITILSKTEKERKIGETNFAILTDSYNLFLNSNSIERQITYFVFFFTYLLSTYKWRFIIVFAFVNYIIYSSNWQIPVKI